MLHAYRLIYPCSQHAPPRLWEYEQPYIGDLILNARTFDRLVVQLHFRSWEALARENARIWDTYYRPYPLNDHLAGWAAGLEEYRELVVEVQEIYETNRLEGNHHGVSTI